MKPTTALRKILSQTGCTLAVSAHDPLLARLVEQAGFELIGLSGNAVSAFHLGLPDMGFLNLSDMDEGKKLWLNDLSVLEAAGYRIASYPGTVRYAVVHSVREALNHLKQSGSSIGLQDRLAAVDDYFSAVDLAGHLEMEKRFLRPFTGKRTP